ncbi:hypothetical protein HFP51_09580 [Parasphingopyxis sp. CP4]|uniref:hypothetical protein n=1 Tax=Parasphingopyxis sp. CP4 TaxID=2724527 RepID=UPI0015A2F247|nr:hypothetical protein [Parasphingopyxis sp. CP4]QLC22405.1 hypothetical protein HFP51_09580 [Parasphingopyxis sp. CP4]
MASSAPFDPISYYLHISVGIVGLLAALIALSTKKGSRVHIFAGRTFAVSILVVAISSLVLLSVRMAPPLLVAALTSVYAVGTALLALKPATRRIRTFETGFFIFEIGVVLLFLSFAIPQVAAGNIPLIGPLAILAIPIILLAGDVHFFRNADRRAALRIRRHLARMIWAFAIAVRAPLAEVYSQLEIPIPFILIGPLIVAPMLIAVFLPRYPVASQPR